jgi:hypothetical protein
VCWHRNNEKKEGGGGEGSCVGVGGGVSVSLEILKVLHTFIVAVAVRAMIGTS